MGEYQSGKWGYVVTWLDVYPSKVRVLSSPTNWINLNEMKKIILNTINDLCSNFLFYDRKEGYLTVDKFHEAVKTGEITIDEMVAEFRKHLEKEFN